MSHNEDEIDGIEAEGMEELEPEGEEVIEEFEIETEMYVVEKADSDPFADIGEAEDGAKEEADEADDGFTLTASLARDIEAVMFISPEPVGIDTLAEITEAEGEELAHAIEAVREKFSDPDGGIVFAEVAGGYTFRTSDRALPAVERFCRRPVDYSLSPAAMETLAIIAYLQPVSRPDIARIRGVGADTVVANLLEKGLVMEAGRAEQTGAIRYRTTEAFEKLFGLADLASLPPIEGFEATPGDVEELREKLYLAAEKRV